MSRWQLTAVAVALVSGLGLGLRDAGADRDPPRAPGAGAARAVYDGTYYDFARVLRVEALAPTSAPASAPSGCAPRDDSHWARSRPPVSFNPAAFVNAARFDAAMHRHFYALGAGRAGGPGCRGGGALAGGEPHAGYRVTYEHRGRRYLQIMDVRPGPQLRVRVSVVPAG